VLDSLAGDIPEDAFAPHDGWITIVAIRANRNDQKERLLNTLKLRAKAQAVPLHGMLAYGSPDMGMEPVAPDMTMEDAVEMEETLIMGQAQPILSQMHDKLDVIGIVYLSPDDEHDPQIQNLLASLGVQLHAEEGGGHYDTEDQDGGQEYNIDEDGTAPDEEPDGEAEGEPLGLPGADAPSPMGDLIPIRPDPAQ
jgi:hypothetical protein